MFSMQSVSQNPGIATFQLSSAASLNLGRSKNSIHLYFGMGLISLYVFLLQEDCRDVRKKRNEASTTQGIKMAQASKDIKSTVASDKGSSAESKKATQDSKIPTPDSKKTKEQSSAVTQEAKNIQQENRKPSTETSYSPKDVVKVKGTGKNVGSPDSKKAQAGKTEQKGKEGPPKPDAKNPAVLSQDTGLDTQQKKDASKSSAPRV